MRLIKRAAPALAALAATSTLVLAPTSAHALTAPIANDDYISSTTGTAPTGNLLANDTWDGSLNASLTNVWLDASQSNTNDPGTITFRPDGSVTVTFDTPCSGKLSSTSSSAHLGYNLTDSAGQSSTGTAFVFEKGCAVTPPPPTPLIAVSDDLYQDASEGSTSVPVAAIANDSHPATGWSIDLISSSVPDGGTMTASADGTGLSLTGLTVDNDVHSYSTIYETSGRTSTHTATFSYRLCETADSSVCSDPVDSTIHYWWEQTPSYTPAVSTRHSFWQGGPTTATYNLLAEARAAGIDPTGLTAWACDDPAVNVIDDPCWHEVDSVTLNQADYVPQVVTTQNADDGNGAGWHRTRYALRDSAGAIKDLLDVDVANIPAPAAPHPTADVAWATFGQQIPIRLGTNDSGYTFQTANWIPSPIGLDVAEYNGGVTLSLGDSTLGTMGVKTLFADGIPFTAGTTRGQEILPEKVCIAWPTNTACADTTLTIHVTPDVAAAPDKAVTKEGQPVTIDELANDTYTDTGDTPTSPVPSTARVTLGTLPTGITSATVNPDRTVTVRGKAGTYSLPYALRDWTGAARTHIRVTITKDDVVQPPIARHDSKAGYPEQPIVVPVLANDTWRGGAKVELIGDAPDGVTAHLDRNQDVVVTVPVRLAGTPLSLTYRLFDDSGLSDTATVTVFTLARAVTGMPIETAAPTASDGPTGHGNLTLLGGGLAGLGLLTAAGLLGAHRRRRADS